MTKTSSRTRAAKTAGRQHSSQGADRMPQSKTAAAAEAKMFLHADDRWSKAYFDTNDLHCLERELFA